MDADRFDSIAARAHVGVYLRSSRGVPDEQGVLKLRYDPPVDPGPLAPWVSDDWLGAPARDLVPRADALLDLCARIDGFHCCTLGWGMAIDVDGRDWTGELVDHFPSTIGWVTAARAMALEGDGAVGAAMLWDQSSFVMIRDVDHVLMFDPGADPYDDGVFRPIRVPRLALLSALADAGADLMALADALTGACLARGHDPAALAPSLAPDAWAKARAGDHATVAAILGRELWRDHAREALAAIRGVVAVGATPHDSSP